jgi:uncharacterized membrane protein YdbT with pleckstrin-like domain
MSMFLLTGLLLAIAGAGLLLVNRWPDYFFWIVIVLLFDPTGHLTVYLNLFWFI